MVIIILRHMTIQTIYINLLKCNNSVFLLINNSAKQKFTGKIKKNKIKSKSKKIKIFILNII